MSLLLAQKFTKCHVPDLPAAGTYQLMFQQRPGDGDPLPTLPTGHWGGTARDTADDFYGDLSDLTHVKKATVTDRYGDEYEVVDKGLKFLTGIAENSPAQNTCRVRLATEGENPFGGFCFDRVVGSLYIVFGLRCSFYSDSETFPIMRINLHAGRGTNPLQTWTLSDLTQTPEPTPDEWWSYNWASRWCTLTLNEAVIDYVSNKWEGAIIEFIAVPNGWNEEHHHGGGQFDADTSIPTPWPGGPAWCLADSDITDVGCTLMAGSAYPPVTPKTTVWESVSTPAKEYGFYFASLSNEHDAIAHLEVGLEKPTIGANTVWNTYKDGVFQGNLPGIPDTISSVPCLNAPGWWDDEATATYNAKTLIVELSGLSGGMSCGPYADQKITFTVLVGGDRVLFDPIVWSTDNPTPWSTTTPWAVVDGAALHVVLGGIISVCQCPYNLTEDDWASLSRAEQETLSVKIEIEDFEPYPWALDKWWKLKVHSIRLNTGPTPHIGIYMPKGSNSVGSPGFEAPDQGKVEYWANGVNRISMVEVIDSIV